MWTFAQEEFCQDGNEPVQRGFESPRHALSSIDYRCFYFFKFENLIGHGIEVI